MDRQIDRFLERKAETAELFDEAAGIVKFKRRKLIAQKKLERRKTESGRVNDIFTRTGKNRWGH